MMKNLYTFVLFICFTLSCSTPINETLHPKQVNTSFECNCTYPVEPFYNTDTLLNGGYHLKYYNHFSVKDSQCLQIVDLMKGKVKIKQINVLDYRFNHGRLGWSQADFNNAFLFIQGISSSPNFMRIIEKRTGKTKLEGYYHNEIDGVIMYSTFKNEKDQQELRIADLKYSTDFEIKSFLNMKCEWDEDWFADCIELDSISDSHIFISMETTNEKVNKKYNRLK